MLLLLFFISGLIYCTIAQELGLVKYHTNDVEIAFAPDYLDGNLYFLNFVTSDGQADIFRFDTDERVLYGADIIDRNSPSLIIPIQKGGEKFKKLFAVATGHNLEVVEWNGKTSTAEVVETLCSLETDDNMSRINYGRTDSYGRLYLGTISMRFCDASPDKSFYLYIDGQGITLLYTGIYSTTAIAINEEEEELYHLDTCTLILFAFRWNRSTGIVDAPRVAFNFQWIGKVPGSFIPVGMDIGANGLLYISDYQKSIYVINPKTNSIVVIYNINQQGIAGLAFAGTERNRLYLVGGSGIVNVQTATITQTTFSGTSVYALIGLDTTGREPTFLNIN